LPASDFGFLLKVVWFCEVDSGICPGFTLETSPFIFLMKAVVSIDLKKTFQSNAIKVRANVNA